MKFDSFCTIDIILFVVFILAGISGARKGLLEEVSQKFGFVFGFSYQIQMVLRIYSITVAMHIIANGETINIQEEISKLGLAINLQHLQCNYLLFAFYLLIFLIEVLL